jgi:aspartyl-tRNA(Asn)/glutamyl-tRNA(Gln) amidotransferase subunit C
MPALSRKEVEEIALLARLALSDAELGALERELGTILEHVSALQRIDTTDVAPMTHATVLDLPLRADTVAGSLPVPVALGGSARHTDELFVVPAIISGGDDA